jgi:hypothetical protein
VLSAGGKPIMGAIEDILEWSSTKLSSWKQDALRRLACQSTLSKSDYDELLNLIKASVGFALTSKPADAIPLEKAHFASASPGAPLQSRPFAMSRTLTASSQPRASPLRRKD